MTLGMAVMLAVTAVAAQQADDSQVRARQRIAMMEGTLESAVKIGAENLLRQVRSAVPDPPMLAGTSRRRFRLDGTASSSTSACRCSGSRSPAAPRIDHQRQPGSSSVAAELKQLIAQMDARSTAACAGRSPARDAGTGAEPDRPARARRPHGGGQSGCRRASGERRCTSARQPGRGGIRARSSRRSSTR